jgi:hypothetical protein
VTVWLTGTVTERWRCVRQCSAATLCGNVRWLSDVYEVLREDQADGLPPTLGVASRRRYTEDSRNTCLQ